MAIEAGTARIVWPGPMWFQPPSAGPPTPDERPRTCEYEIRKHRGSDRRSLVHSCAPGRCPFEDKPPEFGDYRSAFDLFAAKAPVRYPGPQAKAHTSRPVFDHLLTPRERDQIDIARGHAAIGEGRGEFDTVMWEIRKRLGWDRPPR